MFTTDYTFEKILNFQLRNTSIPAFGSTWYIGLSTKVINSQGGNITELSGYGYARKPYPRNEISWSIPENGELYNINPISFSLVGIETPPPGSLSTRLSIKSIFISNSLTSIARSAIFYVSNLTPYVYLDKYTNYNLILNPGSIRIKRFGKQGEYYASN